MNCSKCNKLLTGEYLSNGEIGHHIVCPKEGAINLEMKCRECQKYVTISDLSQLDFIQGIPTVVHDTCRKIISPDLTPSEREGCPHGGKYQAECLRCYDEGIHPDQHSRPLLSMLLFVTGEVITMHVETNRLKFGVEALHITTKSPMLELYSKEPWATFNHASFDQIKADLEAFATQLEDSPVPRIERQPNGHYHLIDVDNNLTHQFSPYEWMVLSHVATNEIPVHEPKTYQAKWTKLYPKQLTNWDIPLSDLSKQLKTDKEGWNALHLFRGEILEKLNSLQSKDFSVWRFMID